MRRAEALTENPVSRLLNEMKTVTRTGSLFEFTPDDTSLSHVLGLPIPNHIDVHEGILGQRHRTAAEESTEADIIGGREGLERLSVAARPR